MRDMNGWRSARGKSEPGPTAIVARTIAWNVPVATGVPESVLRAASVFWVTVCDEKNFVLSCPFCQRRLGLPI